MRKIVFLTSVFFIIQLTSCEIIGGYEIPENCAVAVMDVGKSYYSTAGLPCNRLWAKDSSGEDMFIWFEQNQDKEFKAIVDGIARGEGSIIVCFEYGKGGRAWYIGDDRSLTLN